MWLSPSFQDADFRQPLSVDDQITIFEDRTLGWKLDIADQIINGRKRPDGSEERPPVPHSGYATLDIVVSYFEMIAKYEDGYAQEKPSNSAHYFRQGVYSVFPALKKAGTPPNVPEVQGKVVSIVDYALEIMYKGVRCGLYHSGITNGRVILTRELQQPIAFDLQSMALIINPHLLVPALKAHFSEYIGRLRDPNSQELRRSFEARFNFDSGV